MAANYIIASALSALLLGVPSSNPQIIPNHANHSTVGCDVKCGGGYLGVMIDDVDKTAAQTLKLPEEKGAKITRVMPESPAAKAGLQQNDVIVKWNDTPVEGALQLGRLAAETPVGRSVKLTVYRNGQTREIKAEMGRRDMREFEEMEIENGDTSRSGWFQHDGRGDEEEIRIEMNEVEKDLKNSQKDLKDLPRQLNELKKFNGEAFKSFGAPNINIQINHSRLGATLQNMSPQLAKYFGVAGDKPAGALVGDVTDNSAAAKGGLHAGDVITAIDGEAVNSPTDVPRIIQKKEGTVSIKVLRDKQEQTVSVDLGKPDPKEGLMNFNNMEMNMNMGEGGVNFFKNGPFPGMKGNCMIRKHIIINGPKGTMKTPPPVPMPPPPPGAPPTIL